MCTLWGEATYQCGIMTPWWITVPIGLLESVTFVVAVVGIVYAYQGKAKELIALSLIKVNPPSTTEAS